MKGTLILKAVGAPFCRIPVKSADQARKEWEFYRDSYALGASECTPECGNIVDPAGNVVARVSYNGRIWSPSGELLEDIEGGFPVKKGWRYVN